MQKLLLSISLVLCISFVQASEKADHSLFDKLLKKHVTSSGKVHIDYVNVQSYATVEKHVKEIIALMTAVNSVPYRLAKCSRASSSSYF